MRRWWEALTGLGVIVVLLAVLLHWVQNARQAARQSQWRNNLKHVGLALHNYHDVWSSFPIGASVSDDGEAHHGWFTRTLPFLDSSPLYHLVDMNQPWDETGNSSLFQVESSACQNPSINAKYSAEGYYLMHLMANPAVFHKNATVSMGDFQGGTDHSWLVGSITEGFQPWGYPYNWQAWDGTLNQPASGYGSVYGPTMFLLASGRVVALHEEAASELYERSSTNPQLPDAEKWHAPKRTFEVVSERPSNIEHYEDRDDWNRATRERHQQRTVQPDGDAM